MLGGVKGSERAAAGVEYLELLVALGEILKDKRMCVFSNYILLLALINCTYLPLLVLCGL
jgi:hypothetical protein